MTIDYNPNTQETEAVDGKLEASLGYAARLYLKRKTNKKCHKLCPSGSLVLPVSGNNKQANKTIGNKSCFALPICWLRGG